MDGFVLILLGVLFISIGYIGNLFLLTRNEAEEILQASQEWTHMNLDRFIQQARGRF